MSRTVEEVTPERTTDICLVTALLSVVEQGTAPSRGEDVGTANALLLEGKARG